MVRGDRQWEEMTTAYEQVSTGIRDAESGICGIAESWKDTFKPCPSSAYEQGPTGIQDAQSGTCGIAESWKDTFRPRPSFRELEEVTKNGTRRCLSQVD